MSMMKASGDVHQEPGDPVPPQTPTVTHYQQIAADLAKVIDEMLARIPSFVEAHPDTTIFVGRRQNVPLQFIATAVAAVEASPELQGGTFDATEVRDALQFIEAFRPMADRLHAAATNLTFSINSRKANAGTRALEVYAIAKRVALNPLSTTVASHVGNLKRDMGRRGGVRKKQQTHAPGASVLLPDFRHSHGVSNRRAQRRSRHDRVARDHALNTYPNPLEERRFMSHKNVQHPACSVIPLHMQRHLAEHGDDGRTPVVALAAVPLVLAT